MFWKIMINVSHRMTIYAFSYIEKNLLFSQYTFCSDRYLVKYRWNNFKLMLVARVAFMFLSVASRSIKAKITVKSPKIYMLYCWCKLWSVLVSSISFRNVWCWRCKSHSWPAYTDPNTDLNALKLNSKRSSVNTKKYDGKNLNDGVKLNFLNV